MQGFRNFQYVLAAVTAVVLVLAYLSRRYPHVHWLRHFRMQRPYDPERDRHLDTAWTPPPGFKHPKPPPGEREPAPRAPAGAFREFLGDFPRLPEEQRRRFRKSSNIMAGLKFILLGIALPFGYYIFSMMMFFQTVSKTENIILFTVSAACVILGITAIVRGARD